MSHIPAHNGGSGDDPIDVDATVVPGGSEPDEPGSLLDAILGSAILSGMLGVGMTAIAAYFLFRSIAATALWFCFDDALAAALQLPGIGLFEWWQVLLMVVFLSLVLGRRSAGPTVDEAADCGGARVRRRSY